MSRSTRLVGSTLLLASLGAAAVFFLPTLKSRTPAVASAEEEPSADLEEVNAPTSAHPLPVSGVVVERAPFVASVRASGRVDAPKRVDLTARVGERIDRVLVREGDVVTRGQLLVELDDRTFAIALEEAEAAVANAEVDYSVSILNDDGSGERRRLAAHRSGLTAATQARERARLELDATRILAPMDGAVVAVPAVEGGSAVAGETLVTLVDTRDLRLRADVLETDFGTIAVEARTEVTFAAFPDRPVEGRVTALSPVCDPATGMGTAYIALPNDEGRIRPGMYADVRITAEAYADRIAVPQAAVLERDRKRIVFRASSGRAEWQYVDTGLESDTHVEITNGLAPGDTVLVGGHLTLAHGAPVSVRVEAEAP